MSFFDKINNYLIVNAKCILKGRDPEESLPIGQCLSWHIPEVCD